MGKKKVKSVKEVFEEAKKFNTSAEAKAFAKRVIKKMKKEGGRLPHDNIYRAPLQ